MARDLHHTLAFLAARHCATHGWENDHVFTVEETEVHLNKRFFAFSVFYTSQTFWIDINFPVITRPRRGSPSRWEFVSAPVTRIDSAQPLPIADRLTIFLALLIIEQHVRLVLKELYLDGRADLEATLS